MKNPNSPLMRARRHLQNRWSRPDFPGGDASFQVLLFARDVAIFVLLPGVAVLVGNAWSKEPTRSAKTVKFNSFSSAGEPPGSQVIRFDHRRAAVRSGAIATRAPGTLVRVKLLNVVESLSETPVHVQIQDESLGSGFYGGVLVGEGTADMSFSRLNISFSFAKKRNDPGHAYPISARALSLDGTLGLEARQKDGAFARGVLAGSAAFPAPSSSGQGQDLRSLLMQALLGGMAGQFKEGVELERKRGGVLILNPGVQFLVELKDYFPSGPK